MEDLLTKAFYVACLLGVALFGFWLRYVSRSIGLLFAKHDESLDERISIKLMLMKLDPLTYTSLFAAKKK